MNVCVIRLLLALKVMTYRSVKFLITVWHTANLSGVTFLGRLYQNTVLATNGGMKDNMRDKSCSCWILKVISIMRIVRIQSSTSMFKIISKITRTNVLFKFANIINLRRRNHKICGKPVSIHKEKIFTSYLERCLETE